MLSHSQIITRLAFRSVKLKHLLFQNCINYAVNNRFLYLTVESIFFGASSLPTQSRHLRWMEDHYSGSLILLHWWWVVYWSMSQLFSGGNYNRSQQPFHCRIHVNTFILSALLQTCRPFMWKSEPALRKDYRIPKVKHGLTWSLFHQEGDTQDDSLLSGFWLFLVCF